MTRAVLLGIAVLATSISARAEDAPRDPPRYWSPGQRTTSQLPSEIGERETDGAGDGVYGRFDGLFDVAVEAGAELDGRVAAGAAAASIHYLFTAGLRIGYADALGNDHAASERILSLGVDVRPAFIPRWSNALQTGSGFGDLVIDSISLGLGGYFRQPEGRSFGDRRGLELSLGVGLPVVGQASGPWLGARGLLRWDDPGDRHAAGADAVALLTFGWHVAVGGG
jgi:hypothetical protein